MASKCFGAVLELLELRAALKLHEPNRNEISMPVELGKRRDLSRVNTRSELRYWCGRFVCTEQELKDAVGHVGVSAAKVERYLDERRQRTDTRRPVVRAR